MKTKTLAALALSLCTVAAATAQPAPPPASSLPPDHPVSVIDPNLPQDLPQGLRHQFLDEVENTLSSLVRGIRVIRSDATETLVVWADKEQLEKARKLTSELKAHLVERTSRSGGNRPVRDRAAVRTVVQVVVASSSREKPHHPLDPELAAPLAKTMGYSRFEVVGHAMAEGSVGEETKLFAHMPWPDGYPVGLQAMLVPFADDDGGVRVRAQFSVSSEVDEEGEGEGEHRSEIVEGSVETTYRPVVGRSLVVGATPMGGGRSLLFVVTHSGEGVE